MSHARELLDWGSARLPAPCTDARAEAEILLAHLLRRDRSWLYAWPEHEVNPAAEARYRELIQQRASGIPLAYLTGKRNFWSLELAVDRHTLIPRPETEHLVEFALERLPRERPLEVLDLGTGSGAIALALAAERPAWRISATDRSAAALRQARKNAERLGLGVRFIQADWLRGISGPFDLIVSNPPYVAADDRHLQQGDLRFEPLSALAAGPDGLADIRRIVGQARSRLRPGGWLLFEHGFDQGKASRELLKRAGYGAVGTGKDLAGHERYSHGIRENPVDRQGLIDHD